MSRQQDSGAKTEKATPRRLREARRRGEVARSRDVSSTLGLAFILALMWLMLGSSIEQLAHLAEQSLTAPGEPFGHALRELGTLAIRTFISLLLILLLPLAAFGLLVDFVQVGPVFAPSRLKPSLDKLNPVTGMARVFSLDNFVELLKNVVKTLLLGAIVLLVVLAAIDELVWLPANTTMHAAVAVKQLLLEVLGWTLALFLLIAALDAAYQRQSFAKRMRMSLRDIRQERKDTEGDPLMKNQRRQLHKDWAQQGAVGASRSATVLVVNPTHVAIAIVFDRLEEPVPRVMAKGEEETARAMREAADESHVPVLRNEYLARTLLADVEEGDPIPHGLFDIMAEVLLWAMRTTNHVRHARGLDAEPARDEPVPPPPGDDLTRYPTGMSPPLAIDSDA